jgi:hypothetical protein
MRFFVRKKKKLNPKDILKEMFSVHGGKCFSRKTVPPW